MSNPLSFSHSHLYAASFLFPSSAALSTATASHGDNESDTERVLMKEASFFSLKRLAAWLQENCGSRKVAAALRAYKVREKNVNVWGVLEVLRATD